MAVNNSQPVLQHQTHQQPIERPNENNLMGRSVVGNQKPKEKTPRVSNFPSSEGASLATRELSPRPPGRVLYSTTNQVEQSFKEQTEIATCEKDAVKAGSTPGDIPILVGVYTQGAEGEKGTIHLSSQCEELKQKHDAKGVDLDLQVDGNRVSAIVVGVLTTQQEAFIQLALSHTFLEVDRRKKERKAKVGQDAREAYVAKQRKDIYNPLSTKEPIVIRKQIELRDISILNGLVKNEKQSQEVEDSQDKKKNEDKKRVEKEVFKGELQRAEILSKIKARDVGA